MSDLTFKIDATSETPARTRVKTRNFSIIVDEPPALGGTDEGANPVEYLLAAYAGCLNVVGHLVAKEKGITLKGLSISIEGDLNPAKLFGKSDAERAGYKTVRVVLKPDTDADQASLDAWVEEVEQRCPVSDTVCNATPVTVTVET